MIPDDYERFEAVLLRRAPGSWIVKITAGKKKGWSGPIGFGVACWEGGEPSPGKPRTIMVKKWWVSQKIRKP
jgi:hypothetical protein